MFDATRADLPAGDDKRPRRARHRRGLRGAGKMAGVKRGRKARAKTRADRSAAIAAPGPCAPRSRSAVHRRSGRSVSSPSRPRIAAAISRDSSPSRCTILKPLALSCCSSVGSATAVECWKSCIRTMPLPRFSSLVITDVITLSGFLSLKSKESTIDREDADVPFREIGGQFRRLAQPGKRKNGASGRPAVIATALTPFSISSLASGRDFLARFTCDHEWDPMV